MSARFQFLLRCGHSVYLGVPALTRHPAGLAWCGRCGAYRDAQKVSVGRAAAREKQQ